MTDAAPPGAATGAGAPGPARSAAYGERAARQLGGAGGRSARRRSGPAEPAWLHPDGPPLVRFTGAERALHWTVAAAVLTCAVTGLILYVGPLSAVVGRRVLVKNLHVFAGLAIPVPFLVAYAGRWRAAVRRDIRRLARWTRADRRWLRTRGRDATGEVGKFNGGQKANAAFIAGMIPIMLATGSIMRWFEPFPLSWRTGATFVHDWTAIGAWAVIAGHILMALSEPSSLRGMVTGRVPRRWAHDHHPVWTREQLAPAVDGDAGGSPGAPVPADRR